MNTQNMPTADIWSIPMQKALNELLPLVDCPPLGIDVHEVYAERSPKMEADVISLLVTVHPWCTPCRVMRFWNLISTVCKTYSLRMGVERNAEGGWSLDLQQ